MKTHRSTVRIAWAALCIVLVFALYEILANLPFSAGFFHIETLTSPGDADGDGTDDYTDILLSARAYIETKPVYKSAYYAGGYPPAGEGVCTDVIWQALAGAGYDLKTLVDADIALHPENYPAAGKPDPNIDFRRVRNLKVFFDTHLPCLSLNPADIEEWQPGDIVTFSEGHIGIVSDRRNFLGRAYLIHHGSGTGAEEDALLHGHISGHYRWDAKAFLPS